MLFRSDPGPRKGMALVKALLLVPCILLSRHYIPLPYSGKKAAKKSFKQNDYQINPIAKQYLKKIAYQCKIHGISFVVCMSPLYSTRDLNYDSIKDLCKKYTIKVWDMRESISDPLLFKDATHLNERGAIQFTSKLINKLKELNTPYT